MLDEGNQTVSEADISASLVSRIAGGDRAAENEMYTRYARAVIWILRRRGASQEEAEDICHDTFVTACLKLRPAEDNDGSAGIRQAQSLASYLQGIAVRKLMSERRKAVRHDTWADSDAIDRAIASIEGPFENAAAEEIRATIRAALNKLTVERDRDILVSVYLRDEDRDSIRDRLQIAPEHLDRVIYRAKQRLADKVKELLADRGAEVSDLRDFARRRH